MKPTDPRHEAQREAFDLACAAVARQHDQQRRQRAAPHERTPMPKHIFAVSTEETHGERGLWQVSEVDAEEINHWTISPDEVYATLEALMVGIGNTSGMRRIEMTVAPAHQGLLVALLEAWHIQADVVPWDGEAGCTSSTPR